MGLTLLLAFGSPEKSTFTKIWIVSVAAVLSVCTIAAFPIADHTKSGRLRSAVAECQHELLAAQRPTDTREAASASPQMLADANILCQTLDPDELNAAYERRVLRHQARR